MKQKILSEKTSKLVPILIDTATICDNNLSRLNVVKFEEKISTVKANLITEKERILRFFDLDSNTGKVLLNYTIDYEKI